MDEHTAPRAAAKPLARRKKPGALRYGLDTAARAWLSEQPREVREAVYDDGTTFGSRAGFLALAEEALTRAVDERKERLGW